MDGMSQADVDVADDEDDEIGGEIVCAVMADMLATDRAVVDGLGERTEKLAFAAMRAAAQEAAPHRLAQGARGASGVVFAAIFDLRHPLLLARLRPVAALRRPEAARPRPLWND